jgi:hypothetical protein
MLHVRQFLPYIQKAGIKSKKKACIAASLSVWWPGAESNHRHKDFQAY